MNCLIIEDEKPAQRVLERFIDSSPNLELVSTFKSAMEAQNTLNSGAIDLLFLDINLPLISGIGLLKSLKNPPLVIITTAYAEYALESFELDVVDYLLKPFSFERFVKATNKAFKLWNANSNASSVPVGQGDEKDQIIINVDKVLHQLPLNEVFYISSDRDYVCVQTAKKKYVFVDSLKNWEEKLKPSGFVRVHKSFLINLTHVLKVEGNRVHINQEELPIGRSYRHRFLEQFVG